MSWASSRVTTRPEDRAYSLLGLFDVNMPLLYGEGEEKAFARLQHEFLRFSEDETIFAWRADHVQSESKPYWGLLAPSPSCFRDSKSFERSPFKPRLDIRPTAMTNRGINIDLQLVPFPKDRLRSVFLGILQCNDGVHLLAIVLQRLSGLEMQYTRAASDVLVAINLGIAIIPARRLSAVFLSGKNSAESLPNADDDNFKIRLNDVDSVGQSILVRPSPGECPSVAGFEFYPRARLLGTKLVAELVGTMAIKVTNGSSSWDRIHSIGANMVFHSIDFDPSNTDTFGVSNLRCRTGVGVLAIEVSFTPRDPVASPRKAFTRSSYVVVGLEPPPPNPFGTPSTYVQPWFGFHPVLDTQPSNRAFDFPIEDSNLSQDVLLPGWLLMTAKFTMQRHHYQYGIFYELELSIRDFGDRSD
ncbi:hypothetical protein B0T22DRAFT_34153 [Podospora appendiculata]|uniref:Uncharacterized protein n=1 Tax=Podospora appendiculata TaxID=314037 RepID=A0AAE0XH39_9PEZI|nr:hypothetical protein B0T22DRAFT_34153 [Podospora appendiculata]